MLDTPHDDGPKQSERAAGPSLLRPALRRARAEAAEQADVVMDLRAIETARLELLKDALEPLFAEVPGEVDMFDVGIAPSERPRLFIDMVAFVEMGHDRRAYRFMRDGRRGRSCLAESAEVGPMVGAVTAYVARRLVERERLLVDDERTDTNRAATAEPASAPPAPPAPKAEPSAARPPEPARPPAGRRWLRFVAVLFAFGVGAGLGALVVAALILASASGKLPL